MANQHTARRQAAEQGPAGAPSPLPAAPSNDGPDLGPEPDQGAAAATVTMTADELAAMLEQAAEQAAAAAVRSAQRQLAQPTTTVVNAGPALEVTTLRADPPSEPTYEAGEVDAEGVAYAATIVAVAPNGTQTECTPKVFRTLLARRGYVAHPMDAAQHLGHEERRTRRSARAANVDGTDPELVTASRRRRRAAPAAE